MNRNIKIKTEWDFWLNYPNNLSIPDNQKPIINPSYYFIYNCETNEILYTSDSFQKILGYSKEDYTFIEIMNFLHPDDYNYVMECERKAIEFTSKLSVNELYRFITTYTYRSKTLYGNYIRFRQSYQALEVNDEGRMSRAMVFHEIIDYNQQREADDFKIFDRQTYKFVNSENRFNLTKREIEILDLIKKGFTSVEISEMLHVSKLTVDTHRKNILSKTNSKNFMILNHQSN